MLSWEDCLALCELTEDEVRAIAEHEHIPEIVAVELGNYLVHTPAGVPMIQRMIVDDIRAARLGGDHSRQLQLRAVLRHFCAHHRPTPVKPGAGCCCG